MGKAVLAYGLRQVVLFPLDPVTWERGSGVALPVSRTFSFTDTESFSTLDGDDKTAASHGSGPTVSWSLESGGMPFEAYQVMAGGNTVASGVSPNAKNKFTKKTTDSRPYFDVEGRAISDSGGDVHCTVHRCKADGDLEGGFENGNFALTKAKGTGYGDTEGDDPTDDLYTWEDNETGQVIAV